MQRTAALFIVLFAMLWHTSALSRVGSTTNALTDLQHAALHWLDMSHHHHDDGAYHLDDSKESVQHALNDYPGATVALIVAALHSFAPRVSVAPGGRHEASSPDPALEGPLRPPRLRA